MPRRKLGAVNSHVITKAPEFIGKNRSPCGHGTRPPVRKARPHDRKLPEAGRARAVGRAWPFRSRPGTEARFVGGRRPTPGCPCAWRGLGRSAAFTTGRLGAVAPPEMRLSGAGSGKFDTSALAGMPRKPEGTGSRKSGSHGDRKSGGHGDRMSGGHGDRKSGGPGARRREATATGNREAQEARRREATAIERRVTEGPGGRKALRPRKTEGCEAPEDEKELGHGGRKAVRPRRTKSSEATEAGRR
jgi:hypothetical protein